MPFVICERQTTQELLDQLADQLESYPLGCNEIGIYTAQALGMGNECTRHKLRLIS